MERSAALGVPGDNVCSGGLTVMYSVPRGYDMMRTIGMVDVLYSSGLGKRWLRLLGLLSEVDILLYIAKTRLTPTCRDV